MKTCLKDYEKRGYLVRESPERGGDPEYQDWLWEIPLPESLGDAHIYTFDEEKLAVIQVNATKSGEAFKRFCIRHPETEVLQDGDFGEFSVTFPPHAMSEIFERTIS